MKIWGPVPDDDAIMGCHDKDYVLTPSGQLTNNTVRA